jgi:predicted HTH transcriptional regulator
METRDLTPETTAKTPKIACNWSSWANNRRVGKLTKISHHTALRDIQDLISKGILKLEVGGGRSTAYSLVM